ncbi:MAG: hypothetical protein HDT02_00495 [Bacteroidales bacterium]|nr:hypothetical protein [Bacteroidales bacterium]
MNDKLFLIAIGGTGMRCLESFVHLCAAGLFDNHTIEILTLDTDQNNGNKDRVESLIGLYNKVKTNDASNQGGEQRSNTFFSAKLNLYRFFTDYSTPNRQTLHALASTKNLTDEQRQDNQDLSDLLFERDSVQQFKLDHGYRAQTHLGSMLMYHGIIEAAINAKKGGDAVKTQEKELARYLELINKHAATTRVFVFGSVFGGTGASSIPVIPIAISEALKILTGGNNELNLKKVLFGSTLLTDYFTFKTPTTQQLTIDKIIADANNFALNSQAALSFYNDDTTVKKTYKRMYHIGWPSSLKINYSDGKAGNVVTGGHEQRNDCHVAELMCAVAAYDFFNEDRAKLEKIGEAEYDFRTVAVDDNGNMQLSGASFVGSERGEIFENKLGALLSLAHIILSKFEGAHEGTCGTAQLLNYLDSAKFSNFNELSDAQCAEIDEYLKEFGYKFVKSSIVLGWIYQLFKSVGAGKFIFAPEAFITDINGLHNIDPGTIFADEAHHWDKSGVAVLNSSSDRRFNTLIGLLKSEDTIPVEAQATTLKEEFLAQMYNAVTIAQHFNE